MDKQFSLEELDILLDALHQAKQNGTAFDTNLAANLADKLCPNNPVTNALWKQVLEICFKDAPDFDVLIQGFEILKSGITKALGEVGFTVIENTQKSIVQ